MYDFIIEILYEQNHNLLKDISDNKYNDNPKVSLPTCSNTTSKSLITFFSKVFLAFLQDNYLQILI